MRAKWLTLILALLDELGDAGEGVARHQVLDVALRFQLQGLFDFHLHPQPLAIETVLVTQLVAGHGEIAVVGVLVGAAPGMVHSHGIVGGDGPVEERPLRLAAVLRAQRFRRAWILSQNSRTARSLRESRSAYPTLSNGIALTSMWADILPAGPRDQKRDFIKKGSKGFRRCCMAYSWQASAMLISALQIRYRASLERYPFMIQAFFPKAA